MIEPAAFVDHLGELGVSLFTGVPDSLLKEFGRYVMDRLPRERHVIAANEGAAVGIAIGHHLRTGDVPLIYLQNSGFGNAVNPLLSLADPDVYGVPMVVLIGWRGQPGVKDEPQHVKQGRIMEPLAAAMDLPVTTLPSDGEAARVCMEEAVRAATADSTPYVVLVEKGTFATANVVESSTTPPGPASREDALIAAVNAIGDGHVLVATTGMLSRELFEHRERTGTDASRDFLTVGGMGHASSIALGIAMREADREVWCLDGDGALLMHLGSLAVIASHAPPTYFHIVFNNGVHDSVGGQPTSIAGVDVPALARAVGYRYGTATAETDRIADEVAALREHGGPSMLEIRVRPGNRPDIGRPTRSPAESKHAFMAGLS